MFFNLITEPFNIHYYDVCESYFNAYPANIHSFFRDRDGTICEYMEVCLHSVYRQPYYSEDECDTIHYEA